MDESVISNARRMYAASLEKIESSKILKDAGRFNDALSRAYYGAFHAVSMLFLLAGQSFSRHSQLIGNFNKQFIATGKLPKELGKALGVLYDERQGADYDFYHHSSEDEALNGIEKAEKIIEEIKNWIEQEYSIIL